MIVHIHHTITQHHPFLCEKKFKQIANNWKPHVM